MIPKKLFWMLGYNNLSIILEQERRHWLMKTDNKKQIQDTLTGDIFQGQLDNIGSDIIIESQKLPYKYDYTSDVVFGLVNVDKILKITNSAFPHSAMVNGLMFARIISTNYPYASGGSLEYNHYKIRFDNAETCIIPFGASTSSEEVYADKWIRTTTPPVIMVFDNTTGRYSITRDMIFSDTVTNPVWYYPLTETLQPFDVTDLGGGSYELAAVNDDGYIGYPLFWFTCDQTNVGSNLTFENNKNSRNEQIFFISNEGNATPFNAKIYTGVDGSYDATPDGSETLNYTIKCSCKSGSSFTNTSDDFLKALDPTSITLVNNSEQTETVIPFICTDNDKITMSSIAPWEYVNETTYQIDMSYFDQNCINGDRVNTPLVSIFDVKFDENVPFVKESTDVGIAGVRMGSANLVSDVYERYPYNLNKWEGLPVWMNDLEDGTVPEHLVMYAFHQPPSYDPEDPETMQGAGLILDPGKHQTDGSDVDSTGRVYVLSNDDIEYHNNAKETYPKPARTAARICDIPTSVMQLAGTTNLSPDPIVDKKYVRTEANFSEDDKDRLYNTLATRWVRPTALTKNGNAVWEELGFPNRFAFEGLVTLEAVDMYDHNNFRITENLNPMVDVSKISVRQIENGGNGYAVGDRGVCVVGGFSFSYEVTEIDGEETTGPVTAIDLLPDSRATSINLANFDLDEGTGGISDPYGTSPTSGEGRGLKISFRIDYDYYQSILPYKGEFFNDLFALVRERDGLYVYSYIINSTSTSTPKPGKWTKGMLLSEYELTSTKKSTGGVATQESYINSILPSVRDLPISMKSNGVDPTTIVTLQTASFINIIDKTVTPVMPDRSSDDDIENNVVDMCKLYCDGFLEDYADDKTVNSVKEKLKELNALRFDSYVLWRWDDPNNTRNKKFMYGVVSRSFNNFFTTDTITMLPTNKLRCDNFVHTNGNTTIVWNVPGVGVMMWVYDPTYRKKENYYIDPETMDLHITRENITYEDIDIREVDGVETPNIVEDGRYMFNIMTNNPCIVDDSTTYPIYQQPDMTQFNDLLVGKNASDTSEEHMPCGNWRLVFPRVNSYTLRNDATGTQWIPQKMQVIKGRSISDIGSVYDSDGNDVSAKSVIIDEESDGLHLKMFNSNRKSWDEV